MMWRAWTVGRKYRGLQTSDGTPTIRVSYSDRSGWEVIVGIPDITDNETEKIEHGTIQFAFAEVRDRLFLLYKFADFPWFDTPFEPALYANPHNYPIFPEKMGASLSVVCADSKTGEVKCLRMVGLSNITTNTLNSICAKMDVTHRPLDHAAYEKELSEIYRDYPTSEALLKEANPVCVTIICREGNEI